MDLPLQDRRHCAVVTYIIGLLFFPFSAKMPLVAFSKCVGAIAVLAGLCSTPKTGDSGDGEGAPAGDVGGGRSGGVSIVGGGGRAAI